MVDEFSRFISTDNLNLAWRRIRNSLRFEVKDRLSLRVFSSALDKHLAILADNLLNGEYAPSSASFIYTPKKSKTLRPVVFLSMRDRLVYQSIGNIIAENAFDDLNRYADITVFSPVINQINNDFLFLPPLTKNDRVGQFQKFMDAIQRARANVEHNKYYVRADIAAFYPSIDHSLLIDCLIRHKWLTDERLLELFRKCLQQWSSPADELKFQQGIPIGYETSDLLGNLFLFEIDEQAADFCYMLRYVDDMHFFATSRASAIHALANIDLMLQRRALYLQTSKLEIIENSGPDPETDKQAVIKFQAKLSSIEFLLDQQTSSSSENAEHELLNLIEEIYPSNIDPVEHFSVEKIQDVGSVLAFVFYRLKEKVDWIKNLAFYLLDELPSHSVHICQYLMLYEDDDEVIEKLYEIVIDKRAFAKVRADCLRALVQVSPLSDKAREVARDWIEESNEWILGITGIDILQHYSEEYEFLERVALDISEEHIRASVLAACFQLGDRHQKLRIFEHTISDEKSYLVQSLGAYFVLSQPEIYWSLQHLTENISPLISALLSGALAIVREESAAFRALLFGLCGFEMNDQFPFQDVFEDPLQAKNLIAKAFYSRKTSPNEVVSSIAEFTSQLTNAVVQLLGAKLQSFLPSPLLRNLENLGRNYSKLPDLDSSASILGNTKQAIIAQQVDGLIISVSSVWAVLFAHLHDYWKLEKPESLGVKASATSVEYTKRKAATGEEATDSGKSVEIFVSYAHENEKLKMRLVKHLSRLRLTGLATIWHDRQILPGDIWLQAIDAHLQSAEIVLFLITADFLDSDFIQRREVPIAMERHRHGNCRPIPIILKPVDWHFEPYSALQALPTDGKPVINWDIQDEAYTIIANELRKLIENGW